MTVGQYRRWTKSIVVIALIFSWEFLGSLDPTYSALFSHPVEIIKTIANPNFLRSFGYIWLVPAVSVIPGIIIGVAIGVLILPYTKAVLVVVECLRLSVWLPFLIYWTLPFWPITEPYVYYKLLLWMSGTSVVAISLMSCRAYLISRSILGLQWREAWRYVTYKCVLHAILISLFSQFWLPEWHWRLAIKLGNVSVLYGILLCMLLVLFLIEKSFGTSLEQASAFRKTALAEEMRAPMWRLLLANVLPMGICLVFWQFLAAINFYDLSVSPWDVLKRTVGLLGHPMVLQGQRLTIWGHMGVSLMEMVSGIAVSIVIVCVTVRCVLTNQRLRNVLSPLLHLSYGTSLVVPLIWIYWQMFVLLSPWRSIASLVPPNVLIVVASITFWPVLRSMWPPVEEQPLIRRMSVAVMDALPVAFVGMVFGEAFGSVSGLGFFMIVAGAGSQTIDRVSACFTLVVLLCTISFVFQYFVKQERS